MLMSDPSTLYSAGSEEIFAGEEIPPGDPVHIKEFDP